MGYTLSTLKSLRALLVGLTGVTLIQGSLSSCPIWKCSHNTLLILARRKCKLFYGSAHRVLLSSCTDLEYSSLTRGSILSGYVPNLLAPKTPSTDCLRLLTPFPDLNITHCSSSIQKYAILPGHVDLKNHLIYLDALLCL